MRYAALIAVILLAGCATVPPVVRTVTVKVPVQVPIPAELTAPVPTPLWSPPYTWGSLAQYTVKLQTSLHACQIKLDAIRQIEPSGKSVAKGGPRD